MEEIINRWNLSCYQTLYRFYHIPLDIFTIGKNRSR